MRNDHQRTRSRVRIRCDADVMQAVLASKRMAIDLGFDQTRSQMIATAVSELARNILKYATMGDVFIGGILQDCRQGIEITVRDKGPGIEDVEKALEEHFSSSGTPDG
jgi:serine/threonine-protein kinase RsbT